MKNSWDTPLQYLKGVGPKRAKKFSAIGINTTADLLYYFPRRYEDRTNFISISKAQEDQVHTIKAEILDKKKRSSFRRRGFSIVEATVGDSTGRLSCVWFNQPYLESYLKIGQTLILHGKIERYSGRLQISAPEFEIISKLEDEPLSTGRIVPIYSLPQGITQRYFRQIIKCALDEYLPRINDFLPYSLRSRNNLLNLAKGVLNMHFPEADNIRKRAFERLSFEEFLLFQLPLALRKSIGQRKSGIAHKVEGPLSADLIAGLPFKLTPAQGKVIGEIKSDMAKPTAMQRLLQGDVGSGKTVVATIASVVAIQGGYQTAFMVPTEILARQHFEKISSQIKSIKVGLLVGSLTSRGKGCIYKDIKEGKVDLLIGTHALLEGNVRFKNLGLVVIDEQHKFGVGQRALLPKKGVNPDVLIMTATPIPRTLAITLYGDLDVSVIDTLPPGRLPVETMHFNENQRARAYQTARVEMMAGRQVYVVYPVIEESYVLDIAGAKKIYEVLKAGEFKEFRVGLIHGKLKQKEQDTLMLKFKDKQLDALVSTTVLEVGIDVPGATCMIIEEAQRFGLAQLHQLRGRVGRGADKSYCILIADAQTPEAKARLEAIVKYNDGFRIAEEDLKIRGPGEFFGRRQHGLAELKIANPLTQMRLLKKARDEVLRLLKEDPRLEARQHTLLKEELLHRFPEYEKLILVG